jgi:hypothetical protein
MGRAGSARADGTIPICGDINRSVGTQAVVSSGLWRHKPGAGAKKTSRKTAGGNYFLDERLDFSDLDIGPLLLSCCFFSDIG